MSTHQLFANEFDPTRPISPTGTINTDDWQHVAPGLAELSAALDAGGAGTRHAIPFDARLAHAPLPRAYQWVDGSAYVNHVELVRKARGAEMPPEFWTDPLMYQGGSDSLLGAQDDIVLGDEAWGIDFEAEEIVPKYGFNCGIGRQPFLLLPKSRQNRKREDEEVTADSEAFEALVAKGAAVGLVLSIVTLGPLLFMLIARTIAGVRADVRIQLGGAPGG